MKILITGGHLTPALAFIEYLNREQPNTKVVFVGRTETQVGVIQKSQEQAEVKKLNASFVPLAVGKIVPTNPIILFRETLKLIRSFFTAITILIRQKPTVIVSFGSYVAIPIALAGWVLRIPIITHEQTRVAGTANSFIAQLANIVAVSHPESLEYFPKKKTHLVGNLLRQGLFVKKTTPPKWFEKTTKPLLYITGGNQGSEVINTTVAQCLPQILKKWVVIHQCGKKTNKRNYKKELGRVRSQLTATQRKHYYIQEWITAEELAWIYRSTKGMISRAGANTTEEIARLGIPAILIPLPFSHKDEQLINARALSKKGGALLIMQQHLTPATLLKHLDTLLESAEDIKNTLKTMPAPSNPEKKLFELVSGATK